MDNTEDILIVIYSHATGNFMRTRNITNFLDSFEISAVIDNKDLDPEKPPIVIEVHLFNEQKRNVFTSLKTYIERGGMDKTVKLTLFDTDMPTYTDKAKTFGSAIFKTGVNMLKGSNILVTQEEKERRLAICSGCDYFNHRNFTCLRCGCRLKYKSVLRNSSCPIKKW